MDYTQTKTTIGLNISVSLPDNVSIEEAEALHSANSWTSTQAIDYWVSMGGKTHTQIIDSEYPEVSFGEVDDFTPDHLTGWALDYANAEYDTSACPFSRCLTTSQIINLVLTEYDDGTFSMTSDYDDSRYLYGYEGE